MDTNEMQSAMTAAVEEILETMFFATVVTSSEGAAPLPFGGKPPITAELYFEGKPSGGFRVTVPMNLAHVIGAGFLGQEVEDVSDAQAGEVMCELANMICGSVLSRLESEMTFRLNRPELIPSEGGGCFPGSPTCRWFDLGEGLLTTSLHFQEIE